MAKRLLFYTKRIRWFIYMAYYKTVVGEANEQQFVALQIFLSMMLMR